MTKFEFGVSKTLCKTHLLVLGSRHRTSANKDTSVSLNGHVIEVVSIVQTH